MKLTIGFVGGDTWLDKAIEGISGGQYADISHSFIKGILDSILEAEGVKQYNDPYPGVWLHPLNKYEGNTHVKYVDVDVPDIEAAKSKARDLIGTVYGYTDCIATAAALVNKNLADALSDGEKTAMCSETVTRILRAGGLDILPGIEADQISPVKLYEALKGV